MSHMIELKAPSSSQVSSAMRLKMLHLQIVRLCRQHHLYTALAYLFSRALLDYVAPAAELIVAIASSRTAEQHSIESEEGLEVRALTKKLAYKLLVYLRTCFAGLSYPPGK